MNLCNLCLLQLVCLLFTLLSNTAGNMVKKSVEDRSENRDDNGESNDDSMDSMEVATENDANNINLTCSRRQNSQLHEVRSAQPKQFPFMAAVMSDNNDYICSGTVVSNGLILTSATCVQKSIKYVLLNATKAKRDETTAVLRIMQTEKFPTFTTSNTDKDVGLIYTEKHNNTVAAKIQLSNFTSTRHILDVEALGFGLNAEVGQLKELQFIGLENRKQSFIPDTRDQILGYIDCIATKVVTCFKDFGGPAIFSNELVGIVTDGQYECIKEMTDSYTLNRKIVDILPTYTFKSWLDEKIKKNEEKTPSALAIFPDKPTRRELSPKKKSNSNAALKVSVRNIMGFIMLFIVLLLH